jgi:hypothetical protein
LDGNTSNRNARFYYPFCFKIYAAEESPDVKKLEGFNDRTFKLNTMKGIYHIPINFDSATLHLQLVVHKIKDYHLTGPKLAPLAIAVTPLDLPI